MPIIDNDNNFVEIVNKDNTSPLITIHRDVDPNNEIAIMQKKMAAFLLLQNCKLTNVGKDKKEPQRSIFFFEKGEKLDKAMLKYRKNKDKLVELSKS